MHFNNLIHRDIKSANILIDFDGTCKLADFGGSKKITINNEGEINEILRESDGGTFVGTPNWMAPEVVKGGV